MPRYSSIRLDSSKALGKTGRTNFHGNTNLAISTEPTPGPRYSLSQLVIYALRLGTIGFSGPVALVGYMHRDLVESRKWVP